MTHTFKADEIPSQEISDPAVLSKNPLVSIKMITYNHELYIAQAIEGVVKQKTEYPFELIIGEDCSTDGTMEIVLEYQKKFPDIIRVITAEKNVGMSKNGYRTTKACRGKYIAFCEGDDYWHRSDKLQLQVTFLKRHPSCGLVCSDYDVYFVLTGKRIKNWNQKNCLNPSKKNNIKYILRGTPSSGIHTCTVMAKNVLVSHAIESNAEIFKGKPQSCGDTPLWTAMFLLGEIGYIDESLATYCRAVASATRNPSKAVILRTSIAMKEQMLYLIDKYKMPDAEKMLHLADLWKRKLKLAFYEHDAKVAEDAKKNIPGLSPMEWVQFWGAKNVYLNRMFRPLVDIICRNLIPTVKKD
ncbi:MAG: hypothetical protein BBJ57_10360 [Desulfobacterales bacterium PC51MH44]|nr:MAG: hypothetical protein BBJ57_10360 [Desulfobacterales bacterium PC51MH44]